MFLCAIFCLQFYLKFFRHFFLLQPTIVVGFKAIFAALLLLFCCFVVFLFLCFLRSLLPFAAQSHLLWLVTHLLTIVWCLVFTLPAACARGVVIPFSGCLIFQILYYLKLLTSAMELDLRFFCVAAVLLLLPATFVATNKSAKARRLSSAVGQRRCCYCCHCCHCVWSLT